MWDIDDEEEVTHLRGYDQFIDVNHFVRTGFDLKIPREKIGTVTSMSKVKNMTRNSLSTFYCIPKAPHLKYSGYCYNLFSVLDMREFMYIKGKLEKNEMVKSVDLKSITAEIYHITIFDFFKDEPDIIQLIRDQVFHYVQDLESHTTESGANFDNIYIRNVFHLLQLPSADNTQNPRSVLSYQHQREAITEHISKKLMGSKATESDKIYC